MLNSLGVLESKSTTLHIQTRRGAQRNNLKLSEEKGISKTGDARFNGYYIVKKLVFARE